MSTLQRKRDELASELTILEKRGRDRLFIMAEVLDIAKDGALKTQIMYHANLSFTQLNEFLSLLLDIGHLKKSAKGGKQIYKTTEKGFHYLESYREILSFLRKGSTKYRYVSQLHRMSSALRELREAIDDIETSIVSMTKCPKCEQDIFTEYNYCPYCGIDLTGKK